MSGISFLSNSDHSDADNARSNDASEHQQKSSYTVAAAAAAATSRPN